MRIKAFPAKNVLKTIYSLAYDRHIKWLREQRKQLGMTQSELAAALDKPQSYVAKVERPERRLDVLEYVQWTRALGLAPAVAFEAFTKIVDSTGPSRRAVRKQT